MRRKSLANQFCVSSFSCVVFEHGVSAGNFGFGLSFSLVFFLYSTTIMQERTGERDTRESEGSEESRQTREKTRQQEAKK